MQITVALKEAVEDGLIFFKNRSGGIMTIDTVPPEYIVLVEDTDSRSTLWSRVGASGLKEKSTAAEEEGSATVTGAPEPAAKAMPLALNIVSKQRQSHRQGVHRHPLQVSHSSPHRLAQRHLTAGTPRLNPLSLHQVSMRPSLHLGSDVAGS